ncbi:MAG: hypothetical protein AAF401_10905, partial [Pseudomonadota bacterium]
MTSAAEAPFGDAGRWAGPIAAGVSAALILLLVLLFHAGQAPSEWRINEAPVATADTLGGAPEDSEFAAVPLNTPQGAGARFA